MNRRDLLKALAALAVPAAVLSDPTVGECQPQGSIVYHPGHNCPRCGRTQYVVLAFGPGDLHQHQCPAGTLVWCH